MSGLVDAYGRPLSAEAETELLVPARLAEGPGGYQVAARGDAPARVKWRQLVADAIRRGWDPELERVEETLCVEVPLRQLVEVLEERDILVGLLRGRDGFPDPCVKCERMAEACTCDAGLCWVCGCTEEHACEGGCAWADAEKRVCTSCVDAIGAEDLAP